MSAQFILGLMFLVRPKTDDAENRVLGAPVALFLIFSFCRQRSARHRYFCESELNLYRCAKVELRVSLNS